MANIFDRFNQGFGSFLTPNPPPTNPYIDNLMLDDSLKALIKQQQDAQRQNMGSMFRTGLGTALLEMGAPRRTPGLDLTPLSRIIATINQASQGQGAMGNAFALPMQALQFQALQQKVESEKKLPIDVLTKNNYSGITTIDELKTKIKSNNDYLKANFPRNVNASVLVKQNDDLLKNVSKAEILESINPTYFKNLVGDQDILSSVNALSNIKITDYGKFVKDAFDLDPNKKVAFELGIEPTVITNFFTNPDNANAVNEATKLLNDYNYKKRVLDQTVANFPKIDDTEGFNFGAQLRKPVKDVQDAAQAFRQFITGKTPVDDKPELKPAPEVIIEEREQIDDTTAQTQPEAVPKPEPIEYTDKFLSNTNINYKIVPDTSIEDAIRAKVKINFKNYTSDRQEKEFQKLRKVAVSDIAAARGLIDKQDKILNIVNSLLNETDRKTIKAGTIGAKSRLRAGGEAVLEFFGSESFEKQNAYDDAIARLESEKFFEVIASLKAQGKGTGLGALSDAEGRRFNELLGKLSRGSGLLSESVVIENLEEIRRTILKSKNNILTVFEDAYESPLVQMEI